MATKTGSGLLLPVLLVSAAAVAVFGWDTVVGTVKGGIGGLFGGTELIEDDTGVAVMVAQSAKSKVDECTAKQLSTQPTCDDVKILAISAAKMPFIARNISTAWEAGHEGVLTKDSAAEPANRKDVCQPSFPRPHGGQCDEYPFASTSQGGAGAQEQEVPARENQCQGGTLSIRYRAARIADGDDFVVVITHPNRIAPGPFEGIDIAKDPICP